MLRLNHPIKNVVALVLCLLSMPIARGADEMGASTVEYRERNAVLEGYVARPGGVKPEKPGDRSLEKKPGIVIFHDWMGNGPFSQEKARKLAKEGYVVFAADIYGKGQRPQNSIDAAKFATKYKEDRGLLRARARAAFDYLKALPEVDASRIVAIGFCFGGTTALELARSGAALAGTVSFHGGLATPTPKDAAQIRGPVLVLHGADDPWVPADEVAAFQKEMKDAGVKMQFVAYPGAVHAFTNPAAGNDNAKGAAYNAEADRKAWDQFRLFMKKI